MATISEQLQRWRADPVALAEEACVMRRPDGSTGPPQLSERQKRALRALADPAKKTVALIWPKRSGKTLLAALGLLHASLWPDATSVCLSNSERQALALSFSQVRDLLTRSPKLQDLAEITRTRISFPGWGAEIIVVPCNTRTVAGLTVTGLLHSDELWAATNQDPYFLLAGQTEQGRVLLTSQASGRESHVFELWQQSEELEADPGLFVDYCRFETAEEAVRGYPNPYVTDRFLRARQREFPPGVFRTYFLGWWGETAGGLFVAADVERCFDWPIQITTPELWRKWTQIWRRQGHFRLGAGLDRALPTANRDQSVWSVVAAVTSLDQGTDFYLLTQEILPSGREGEVLAAHRATRDLFGDMPAYLEQYQAADLAEKIPRATLQAATAQAQQLLFGRLVRAVQEGRLHLHPDNLTLRAQLLAMQVDTTKSLPSYGAPGMAADDTVFSLAWAMAAAEEGPRQGRTGARPIFVPWFQS